MYHDCDRSGRRGGAPTGYKSVGDGILYDEAWGKTAELLMVKESEVVKRGIGGGERKTSKVGVK